MATSASLVSAPSTFLLTQTRRLCSLPSSYFKGNAVILTYGKFQFPRLSCTMDPSRSVVVTSKEAVAAAVADGERTALRFKLDNLGPQSGSRKKGKRKGRGLSAGQGPSCGFGMRGQKSRFGPGDRNGFEGGQMPLYHRIPKLRGIAGVICLVEWVDTCHHDVLVEIFPRFQCICFLIVLDPFANYLDRLPFPLVNMYINQILGDGELSLKLNIKARSISTAAKEKLEAAGCSWTLLPGRKKWVKPSVATNLARAEEYFAKKKAD